MDTREQFFTRLRSYLPFGKDGALNVTEDSVLSDLGVNSLHLITLLLELQHEYPFDVDQATQNGMPTTVGDLMLIVQGQPPAERDAT